MSEPEEFAPGQVFECLARHGVDYVLIGGLAGMAHGSSYPSYDIDVAYGRSTENIASLVNALVEMEASLRGAPKDLPFILDSRSIEKGANFTFDTRFGPFDILADAAGMPAYDDLKSAAATVQIEGQDVRVCSIDHLISMKRAANRAKDRLMVDEYVALADEADRRENP